MSDCGVVFDPRVVKCGVYVYMCMYPHNFDSPRYGALTCTFTMAKRFLKKLCKKVSNKVSLDTYSIVRGVNNVAPLLTSNQP